MNTKLNELVGAFCQLLPWRFCIAKENATDALVKTEDCRVQKLENYDIKPDMKIKKKEEHVQDSDPSEGPPLQKTRLATSGTDSYGVIAEGVEKYKCGYCSRPFQGRGAKGNCRRHVFGSHLGNKPLLYSYNLLYCKLVQWNCVLLNLTLCSLRPAQLVQDR